MGDSMTLVISTLWVEVCYHKVDDVTALWKDKGMFDFRSYSCMVDIHAPIQSPSPSTNGSNLYKQLVFFKPSLLQNAAFLSWDLSELPFTFSKHCVAKPKWWCWRSLKMTFSDWTSSWTLRGNILVLWSLFNVFVALTGCISLLQ